MASRVGGVVALDGRGDHRRHPPAADQHGADQGVVDAELATLAASAVLGDLPGLADRLVIAVELGQDELADVVQQGRDRELVALRQAGDLADPLGGDPHGDAVAAKAFVASGSRPGGLDRVVGLKAQGEVCDAVGVQVFDRLADAAGAPRRSLAVVRGAHDRNRESRIGLNRLGHLGRRRRLALAQPDEATARLDQGRHLGDSVERVRKPAPPDAGAALAGGR